MVQVVAGASENGSPHESETASMRQHPSSGMLCLPRFKMIFAMNDLSVGTPQRFMHHAVIEEYNNHVSWINQV